MVPSISTMPKPLSERSLKTETETSSSPRVRPLNVILFCLFSASFFVTTKPRLGSSNYLKVLSNERTNTADRVLQSSLPVETSDGNFNLLHEAQYHLNDPTVRLSPYVSRPWLAYHATKDTDHPAPKPKRKLVLTDFGWNHPDPEKGLDEFPRSLRSMELLQAFVDHPDFDPKFAWSEVMEGGEPIDTSLEYIVMFDLETCFESNYPNQGGRSEENADTQLERMVNAKNENACYNIAGCNGYVHSVLESPLFKAVNASTLLFFDCRGFGIPPWYRPNKQSHQISILSLSSGPENQLADTDMGMPPPAINPITLSLKQRQELQSCQSEETRKHLLTFVGRDRPRSPRAKMFELHNGKDVFLKPTAVFEAEQRMGLHPNHTFESLLVNTKFAATPRGDNRFSYRFTEVLGAGAIPVVHSDGWILPFSNHLIDWSQCAVVIPEAQMNQTIDILKQIDREQRCRMRKYCYEVYQNYFANPEANIAGVLASIDGFRRKAGLSGGDPKPSR